MKPQLNTSQQLIELGLKGMAGAYERQLNQPGVQKQTFDLHLGLMMEAETSERETRKVERFLKGASPVMDSFSAVGDNL